MNESPTLPGITASDARPARVLWVELQTRITTQPIHYRSGDEEAALASVHNLFKTTRQLLAQNRKAVSFEAAAVFLLNFILRPYTARWHRWLVDDRFSDERARRQFRYELMQLQPRISAFADLLRLLGLGAGQSQAARELFAEIVQKTPKPKRPAQMGGPVAAGIGAEVHFKTGRLPRDLWSDGKCSTETSQYFATADEINCGERRIINRRRQALNLESPANSDAPVQDATGLCLSGGGIRSATFCLGIVQVLIRQGMLPQIDYLSTVSGGGYLGTFLTSFLGTPKSGLSSENPQGYCGTTISEAIGQAFEPVQGHESPAVRHLRNNSRYLLSGGLWGRMKVVGLLVTGILTNILLALPIAFLAAVASWGLKVAGYWATAWPDLPWFVGSSPAHVLFFTIACLLVTSWLGLPLTRNLARGEPAASWRTRFRNGWEACTLGLFLLASLAGVLLYLPAFFSGIEGFGRAFDKLWQALDTKASSSTIVMVILSLAPIILGLLTARLKTGIKKKAASILFAVSGPLLFFAVFSFATMRLFDGDWHWSAVAVPTLVVFIWGWLFVDVNEFSPHRYYRAKLCECYMAVRGEDQTGALQNVREWLLHGSGRSETAQDTGVGTRTQLPLSKMNQTGAAPYHLVNAAANLPASHEPNLRGRDCDFYSFSLLYCGGPVCGYVKTETLERLDPHVDLGSAMAISGAAAASNMGVKTQRQYRFLLSLLNARLGYWLRNPIVGMRRAWNGPGPLYLFREMLGWMHENTGYLNLSDGGHIENLALYELLRRRCKFIVVVDGGMGPGMECTALMTAQRYAQIDLGVQFNLDIADLALDANRKSRAYAVFGKIRYSPRTGHQTDDIGWLLYIKLACTGGEPGYVVDYARRNPDFPHQSAADQIYDEAQFEAYRRLGECAAESLFRPELAGNSINPQSEPVREGPRFTSLRGWFQALANNLLPDNDPAFDSDKAR